MAVYIIRHTKPFIAPGICYGQLDIGVCDSFSDETVPIKQFVHKLQGYICVVSPLQRCTILANVLGFKKIVEEKKIQEINCGDWEGVSWDKVPRDQLDDWASNLDTFRFPNGESFEDLKVRVIDFFSQ